MPILQTMYALEQNLTYKVSGSWEPCPNIHTCRQAGFPGFLKKIHIGVFLIFVNLYAFQFPG
jgi:hypothetical protein